MTYYTIAQNNNGGYYVEDDDIGQDTIIEANSKDEAIEKAESIGIYFGYGYGDCDCCGARWSTWNIVDANYPYRNAWNDTAVIHYADGTKEVRGR